MEVHAETRPSNESERLGGLRAGRRRLKKAVAGEKHKGARLNFVRSTFPSPRSPSGFDDPLSQISVSYITVSLPRGLFQA
jgi:hypothetical protein